MKLEVLNWAKDFIVQVLAKIIELSFRIVLFFLPLGVFMFILQSRSKVSSISSLSIYTNDNSVWQHVFPGFILVSLNKNSFREATFTAISKVQSWLGKYKYLLAASFCVMLLALIILGIKR